MGKTEQIKYFKKRGKRIKKYFLLFADSKSPEALHRLRVEIKKVDALVYLLSQCCESKKLKKHFKPIKIIFKQAGDIRTAYLNLELIEKYNDPDLNFKAEETKALEDNIHSFVADSKNNLALLKKSFQNLSKDAAVAKNKCLADSYKKQLREMIDFFSNENKAEELHAYRKKIKLLLYMHTVLSRSFIRKLQLDTSYLDKLQDTVGKWHDAVLAVEFFTEKDHADKKTIATLRRQIQRFNRIINSMALHIEDKIMLRQ